MTAWSAAPFEPEQRVATVDWDPELPEGTPATVVTCEPASGVIASAWDVTVRLDDGTLWSIDASSLTEATSSTSSS